MRSLRAIYAGFEIIYGPIEIVMGRNRNGPILTWTDFIMGRNDPEPKCSRMPVNRIVYLRHVKKKITLDNESGSFRPIFGVGRFGLSR